MFTFYWIINFLRFYWGADYERIGSTCNPANDVWLRTRSATSCALFPLIFAVTCQLEHDNIKLRMKKNIDYKSHSNNVAYRELASSLKMCLQSFKNLMGCV